MKNKVYLILAVVAIWTWSSWILIDYARRPKKVSPSVEAPITAKYSPTAIKIAPALEFKENTGLKQRIAGVASWYDYTLDGSTYWSAEHDTCASRDLKRSTVATITNLETGEKVKCFVNDVIEHPDRDIDLSSHAFGQLAPLDIGLLNVIIEGEFK